MDSKDLTSIRIHPRLSLVKADISVEVKTPHPFCYCFKT